MKHSGNKMRDETTLSVCNNLIYVVSLVFRRMEMQAGWMRLIVAEEEEKPPETLLR